MILINFESISDTKGEVTSICDEQSLFPSTIPRNSIIVDTIIDYPSMVNIGKQPVLYINPQTKEMWYEYMNRQLTPQEEIIILKEENALINYALMMGGLI